MSLLLILINVNHAFPLVSNIVLFLRIETPPNASLTNYINLHYSILQMDTCNNNVAFSITIITCLY